MCFVPLEVQLCNVLVSIKLVFGCERYKWPACKPRQNTCAIVKNIFGLPLIGFRNPYGGVESLKKKSILALTIDVVW